MAVAKRILLWSTLGVFLFGALVAALQSCLGSAFNGWPVVRGPFLGIDYLACVLVGIQILGTAWLLRAVVPGLEKLVAALLLPVLLFVCGILILQTQQNQDTTTLYSGQRISRHEEISELRSHTVFFGRDAAAEPVKTEKQENRRYYAFRHWHTESQLPVLCYCFGSWVSWLGAAVYGWWTWAAARAVRYAKNKLYYLFCVGYLALQLWGPVWDQLGLVSWRMPPVVFSDADLFAWTFAWTIPLLIMFSNLELVQVVKKSN